MKLLDLTFPKPEENLACDEALLDMCEEEYEGEILRFWEPVTYFVVLGYSRKYQLDVNLEACKNLNVPILRRASGGGTVLQGPGCLNFSLILNLRNGRPIDNISKTNEYILDIHRNVLNHEDGQFQVQGISDLTWKQLKCSGNAQRRKKNFVLFHGTFLTGMDLSMIETLLPIPKEQPKYRNQRRHKDFLVNLTQTNESIKKKLKAAWKASEAFAELPEDLISSLAKERYSNDSWNFKF